VEQRIAPRRLGRGAPDQRHCLQLIDSADRQKQNLQMLPFQCVIRANDRTIKEYVRRANYLGVEEVNWTWEWADGGRAVFKFDTELRLWLFKFGTVHLRRKQSG